jgi:hypothetical protein
VPRDSIKVVRQNPVGSGGFSASRTGSDSCGYSGYRGASTAGYRGGNRKATVGGLGSLDGTRTWRARTRGRVGRGFGLTEVQRFGVREQLD